MQIVNYLIGRLLPPRVLPKLLFEDGVPDAWRTLVVVPMLLLSREEVQDDLERLEIRFLANQDPNFHFALLADFPDAPQPVMPEDASLLDAARRGIEALNARYPGRRAGARQQAREGGSSPSSTASASGASPSRCGWAGSASGASWRS